jgi:tetratricopeptide (TPR) repeat protein
MVARSLRMPLEAVLFPLVLIAGWAMYGANHWLEARSVERVADGNVGVLPDGKAVAVLSLGFERLVADLFWIRTVYYIGDEYASGAKWPAAERLANLVTDTDPKFDTAYVVMASVLGTLREDPDGAIRLLEKGAAVSTYWRIHFLLGFQYFMEKQDYARGAKSLERAIELGGPKYLQFLVTRLYTSAGDPTTAMQFIALRLKNEETPQVREGLERRYADIWIQRDLAQIDDAIAKYRVARKTAPKAVGDLVEAGLLPGPPRDPKGGEYFISEGRAATRLEHDELKVNLPRIPRGE